MQHFRQQLMGKLTPRFRRFPLLLKFLDAREMLSVQVHPSDAHPELIPPGEKGKTEAWVVIDVERESRIYAGLRPGTTATDLHDCLVNGTIADHLNCIVPKRGDAVFVPAGTVHTLGGDVVVFDNLSSHPSPAVSEAIERAGAIVLPLPPYRPDFHPIEEMFSKLKGFLRRVGARAKEPLYDAIGEGLREVTPRDILVWFRHTGLCVMQACPPAIRLVHLVIAT